MKSELFNAQRRDFLKVMGGVTAGLGLISGCKSFGFNTGARPRSSRYMGDFAAPKLETVKCAFIGVGARGSGHCNQIAQIEGTQIVGIADLFEDLATRSQNNAKKHGHTPQIYFGHEDAWRQMLLETKPDAVFIATPWELHATNAIGCMLAGAHAFVEIPMAISMEELWKIIDTSEATGRHCMLMENVNYGREELLYLNMVRQGVIGELLHGEAAYIHELRGQMREENRGTGSWRTYQYAKRNGNLYPCHGLGPVSQYMSLARGEDNYKRLVSFSSPAFGRKLYAQKNFPPEHKWNALNYRGGDMNTSIIKTVLGRTILVQWDETSPRPYTRHNLIQGTKGTLKGFPSGMAIEGMTKSYHGWTSSEEYQEIAAKYEHPLFKRAGELAKKMGGHGGMDFLMLYRIIECLRQGEPLDQNVYEGAYWSSVGPLSERSVLEDGRPQDFPDFTRGGWRTTKPLSIIS